MILNVLPIVCVNTENDDLDLIEDMFSRLNEAVPLNADEKRDAIGGPMTKVIKYVSSNSFPPHGMYLFLIKDIKSKK